MVRTRRPIPGMRQVVVYIPTSMYKDIEECRKSIACPLNEFILDALLDAMNTRAIARSNALAWKKLHPEISDPIPIPFENQSTIS